MPLARNWSVATWHGLPNCRPGSQAWSADEAQAFLRTTQNGAAVPAFIFLFVSGMRRGEVRGLRWTEIDRDAAMIRVRQQLQRLDGSPKLDPLRLALATVICLSCRLRVKRWFACQQKQEPIEKPSAGPYRTPAWSSPSAAARLSSLGTWFARSAGSAKITRSV